MFISITHTNIFLNFCNLEFICLWNHSDYLLNSIMCLDNNCMMKILIVFNAHKETGCISMESG